MGDCILYMRRLAVALILLDLCPVVNSSVFAQSNNIAFPHSGVYGGATSDGRPFVNNDGTLNSAVLDAYSRFQLAILNNTPLGDVRKDIPAALRARNPNIKIFAYTMPEVMWCGNAYNPTTFYRQMWDTVKSFSGINPPYSDCNFTGDGFIHLQSGQAPYDLNLPNVNLAKRVLIGGAYKYTLAEKVADLVYDLEYNAVDGAGHKIFDGIFFDVYCDDLSWMETPSVKFDYAAAGYGSDNSDPVNRAAFMQGWTAGFAAFADRLRGRIGNNDFPLVGNCGPGGRLASQFNGWMAENYPLQNGGSFFQTCTEKSAAI